LSRRSQPQIALTNTLSLSKLIFILTWLVSLSIFGDSTIIEEIPVFRVNFYLMGQDSINEEITLQIGTNMDYLNEEFEGKIKFELNRLFMDERHAYIPDLHKAASGRKNIDITALVEGIEESGSINIYLFETYSEDGSGRSMMGFTPILSKKQDKYQTITPKFDRMFIAYPGLSDKTTIVHEMGHFLGLSHPWDMHRLDVELMGLNSEETQRINHMTYNAEVSEFTEEQLTRMQHFALKFRGYLLQKVERINIQN
jgi:hypothetical protein